MSLNKFPIREIPCWAKVGWLYPCCTQWLGEDSESGVSVLPGGRRQKLSINYVPYSRLEMCTEYLHDHPSLHLRHRFTSPWMFSEVCMCLYSWRETRRGSYPVGINYSRSCYSWPQSSMITILPPPPRAPGFPSLSLSPAHSPPLNITGIISTIRFWLLSHCQEMGVFFVNYQVSSHI